MADINYDPRAGHGDQIQTRRDFLQVNLGHLLILITMLTSAVWWFVVYDRQINQTKMTVENIVEAERVLASRVEAIDSNGTHFSQHNIDKELATIKSNADRITKLEQFNADLIQRTDKMAWQLQAINDWVDLQRKKP